MHGDIKPGNINDNEGTRRTGVGRLHDPRSAAPMSCETENEMDQEGWPVSEPEGNTEAYGTPGIYRLNRRVDGLVSRGPDVYSLGVAMEASFRTDYKKPAE